MEITYFLSFNRFVSRHFYRLQTRLFATDDVVFLNIGYEEDPPMGIPLGESDEADRYYIQLYHRTCGQADLGGKDVLEVGCGHGGGASYVTRSMRPATYTGLDLNPAAVAFCERRHARSGVKFVPGNAEHLPFADESFDAVINVESSAAYPHFDRFLAEVARVLRPRGHFLYTDLRPSSRVAQWEADLAAASLRQADCVDVTAEVVRGLDRNTPRMHTLVARMPAALRRVGLEYAGARGTNFYRSMREGRYPYRVYSFVKP